MKNTKIVMVRKIFSSLLILASLSLPVMAAQIDMGIEYFAGKVGINNGSLPPTAALDVSSNGTSLVVSKFKGFAGQAADLTQWLTPDGLTVLASIDKDGNATFKRLNSTDYNVTNITASGNITITAPGTLNNVKVIQPIGTSPIVTFGAGSTLTIAAGKSLTVNNNFDVGAGGILGSNAFTSTSFAPLAGAVFIGGVTIPTLTLGATAIGSTGTQLNYLSNATGTTGTGKVVFDNAPTIAGTLTLSSPSTINVPTILANKMLATSVDGVASWIPVPSTPSTLTNVTSITSATGTTIGDPATTTGKTTFADPLVITPSVAIEGVTTSGLANVTSTIVRIAPSPAATVVTIPSTTQQIVAGTADGQMLIIKGKMASGGVKFNDGVGLNLATPSVTITDGSTLHLIYDSTDSKWIEVSRSLN